MKIEDLTIIKPDGYKRVLDMDRDGLLDTIRLLLAELDQLEKSKQDWRALAYDAPRRSSRRSFWSSLWN